MNDALPQTLIRQDARRSGQIELASRIGKMMTVDGSREIFAGLSFSRFSEPVPFCHNFHVTQPCFCVIAQGRKEVRVGEKTLCYDPANYLLITLELPSSGHVVDATAEKPYLSLKIDLEPAMVSEMMRTADSEQLARMAQPSSQQLGINVNTLSQKLLDVTLRLVRLTDEPESAAALAPLIKREIIYRLLTDEQGGRLLHLAITDGQAPSSKISPRHSARVAKAVARLRRDFDQPLRIDELAQELGMSVSGFHHHFKAVTAMSPLQYQKQIRLQEARRIMLDEHTDAANAGFRVGYEDASHFNRDYKKFFGAPPIQNIRELRKVQL